MKTGTIDKHIFAIVEHRFVAVFLDSLRFFIVCSGACFVIAIVNLNVIFLVEFWEATNEFQPCNQFLVNDLSTRSTFSKLVTFETLLKRFVILTRIFWNVHLTNFFMHILHELFCMHRNYLAFPTIIK